MSTTGATTFVVRGSRRPAIYKAAKRIASAAIFLLVAATVLLFAFIAIGPRTGLYQPLVVLSGSMGHTAPTGSLVLDLPEDAADVRVGQIISYPIPVQDHHVVSHRVVKILKPGAQPLVQTRGDANNGVDPWQTQLHGRVWHVVKVFPGLGYRLLELRRPLHSPLAPTIACAFVALVWLADIWRPRNNRRRQPANKTTTVTTTDAVPEPYTVVPEPYTVVPEPYTVVPEPYSVPAPYRVMASVVAAEPFPVAESLPVAEPFPVVEQYAVAEPYPVAHRTASMAAVDVTPSRGARRGGRHAAAGRHAHAPGTKQQAAKAVQEPKAQTARQA